jgi:hypothetical protein
MVAIIGRKLEKNSKSFYRWRIASVRRDEDQRMKAANG